MPQEYPTLEKEFKKDVSADRYSNTQREYERRRDSVSVFKTGIEIEAGELFFTVPPELSRLSEEVLCAECEISREWERLSKGAQEASMRSLVMDEVISSNEIERVRSTRRQIGEALDSLEQAKRHGEGPAKKFKEFTALYLNLFESKQMFPQSPRDIREIFDAVVAGEIKNKDLPDGEVFRAGSIEVMGRYEVPVHTGVYPEQRIVSMIENMLTFVNSDEVPKVYSAILSHFIFEYIHPFYDGNGRTGRYLLALCLSRVLSVPTVLSLSRVIAENKKAYYNAFTSTESIVNKAEGTHFILTIMRLIRAAQEDLLADLEEKSQLLLLAAMSVQNIPELTDKARKLLYLLAQDSLFAALPGLTAMQMSIYLKEGKQTATKYAKQLEARGLVKSEYRGKPLFYSLAPLGRQELGLVD